MAKVQARTINCRANSKDCVDNWAIEGTRLVEANGTDPGFGQPDLSQRTKFLMSQEATPHSSFEYSCQAKVHLIDFRAAASGEIKGNMQTIAFYVTSDSTPAAHVGSGETSPKRRFGVAMPDEKVNAKWLQRNAVDVTALLFEPNEALDLSSKRAVLRRDEKS